MKLTRLGWAVLSVSLWCSAAHASNTDDGASDAVESVAADSSSEVHAAAQLDGATESDSHTTAPADASLFLTPVLPPHADTASQPAEKTPPASEKSTAPPSITPMTPPTPEEKAAPSANTQGVALKTLLLPIVPKGIERHIGGVLDEVLAAEMAKLSGFEIVTYADIEALIRDQRLKDVMGCEDVLCSADVGGAVGADRIITGSVGRIGDRYVVSLRYLDAVFAKSIARVSLTTNEEIKLIPTLRKAVRRLMGRSEEIDKEALVRKRNPTFWTLELMVGAGFLHQVEDYDPGFHLGAQLAWGGSWGGKMRYYLVGSIQGAYYGGTQYSTIDGLVNIYERTLTTAHLGLRAAYPIAYRDRLRLFAGFDGGFLWERYLVKDESGFRDNGDRYFPELRIPVGIWYRWKYRQSVIVGYRLRMLMRRGESDPISEQLAVGSSKKVHLISELIIGWAFHF